MLRVLVAALLLALTACSSASPTPGSSSTNQTQPDMPLGPDGRPFALTPLEQFADPWALAFLPGSDWMAITERSGRMHVFNTVSENLLRVQGVPEVVAEGQGGLGDVVAGPNFETDHTVYLSWVEAGDGGTGAVVGRGTLDIANSAAHLNNLEVIWRQNPKTSGSGHFSHRLAISPDGNYLFVSSGDRQQGTPAQDLDSNLGKILRLTLDGQPAAGNPFESQGGLAAEVWSYGHRNPLGLAFDEAGRLWSTEMGPQGGDELNLIEEGSNYGWPLASNGSNYDGSDIPDHTAGDGYAGPKVSWNPSISPGSLAIYTGTVFPGWQGDALIGALSGEALIRVHLDGTDAELADTWPMGARIRAVAQGPDGSVWLLEDAPSGRLLRLTAPV